MVDARSERLACKFCGGDVWAGDDGAYCVEPESGGAPGCGAVWDCVGVLRTAGRPPAPGGEPADDELTAQLEPYVPPATMPQVRQIIRNQLAGSDARAVITTLNAAAGLPNTDPRNDGRYATDLLFALRNRKRR